MVRAKVFAYSAWDIVPVLAALLQGAYLAAFFIFYPHLGWAARLLLGLIYAVSISWNINGISHNFLHNPYFCSPALNRLFSIYESLVLGFSQVFYECVHKRHHQGNSDRPDALGETVDWLSVYRYGQKGEAENVLAYTFLGYFRDDLGRTFKIIKERNPREAYWGIFEISLVFFLYGLGLLLNWRLMLVFLTFYFLGQSLSNLNGYYRHYGGNPDVPMAWGVSSYGKIYNWLWFNNGYHAEHHFRPRVHWTKMKALYGEIKEKMREAGTRVIRAPHALGFLDPNLPPRRQTKLRPQLV